MTWILLIDTSGPAGLVALAGDGQLVASRRSLQERDHAGSVNGMVAEVLAEGGITPASLSAVSVCNGPGSYTGLRIGLATAKGLCYALDRPLILHGRLELLLFSARDQFPDATAWAGLLPARKGEYFLCADGRDHQIAIPAAHFTTSETLQIFDQRRDIRWAVRGGWEEDLAVLSQHIGISYTKELQPDIATWIRYTFDSWENNKFADLSRSEPDYLKSVYISKSY